MQREIEDALLNADDEDIEVVVSSVITEIHRFKDAWTLFFAMVGSLLLMIPTAWVYQAINFNTEHDRSLDKTVILLPPVVAGIVFVVQHSLALAFSLAGIAAAVRFRRSLSDTFDTLFIFVAIGVGIAAGIKAIGVALMLSMFFCFTAAFICMTGDGLESHHQMRRKLAKREKKKHKL